MLTKECKKCDSFKPPGSHHCSTCNGCIARMDHHCPWINNCVGFYNQKHFLLFLVYVFLGSTHGLYRILKQGYWCFNKNCYMFQSVWMTVLGFFSAILAIIFSIFVVVMFSDQLWSIVNNTSTIDQLLRSKEVNKKKEGSKLSNWQRI
jgi:uncharacterized membrane protein